MILKRCSKKDFFLQDGRYVPGGTCRESGKISWKTEQGLEKDERQAAGKLRPAATGRRKMDRVNNTIKETLRKKYPAGTRVRLVFMDDDQAPPAGTLGTVVGVDDMATIHVKWDNGCGLGIAYGVDKCERIED